jgi:hypothetical protein
LHKIMKQNDVHFINILNRFWIVSQKKWRYTIYEQ